MAQKKNDMKKPLIILAVVLVAALLAFLIYDEVKTGGYVKELNQAINNTYDLQAGSAVGHTYNYAQDDAENSSEVVRKADFVRSDDGITFHEQTGNEDGTALVSDVFLRPGEYYYLGEDAKWVRNEKMCIRDRCKSKRTRRQDRNRFLRTFRKRRRYRKES